MGAAVLLGDIDRAVEYALEKKLTALGRYPDKDSFLLGNDAAGFEAARTALLDAGQLLEVYGHGNYRDRGEIFGGRYVIEREGLPQAESNFLNGMECFEPYEQDGRTFYRYTLAPRFPFDVEYSVRMLSNTTEQDRTLIQALAELFGERAYIPAIDSDRNPIPNSTFLIEKVTQGVNISRGERIETLYRFKCRDIVLSEGQLIDPQTPAIEEIHIFVDSETNDPSPDSEAGVRFDYPQN